MPRAGTAAWTATMTTAAMASLVACAGATTTPTGSPHVCTLDSDCGDHAYCTEARVCRTDCFADLDCLGPSTTVQCTQHGRCIDTSGDAGAVDSLVDDAPLEDIGDGGDAPAIDGPVVDAPADGKGGG